ncbi:hypothetical protein GCM10009847_02310 [Leucobacter tardus]
MFAGVLRSRDACLPSRRSAAPATNSGDGARRRAWWAGPGAVKESKSERSGPESSRGASRMAPRYDGAPIRKHARDEAPVQALVRDDRHVCSLFATVMERMWFRS